MHSFRRKIHRNKYANVLQELGGWSSYDMVLKYAHLAPDHLIDYANNVSGIVAKSVAVENMTRLRNR